MADAFALAIFRGKIIVNLQNGKICGFSRFDFSRVGPQRETTSSPK